VFQAPHLPMGCGIIADGISAAGPAAGDMHECLNGAALRHAIAGFVEKTLLQRVGDQARNLDREPAWT
jgi:hypothetical protein